VSTGARAIWLLLDGKADGSDASNGASPMAVAFGRYRLEGRVFGEPGAVFAATSTKLARGLDFIDCGHSTGHC
jgi:hypothetical protein